MSDRPPQKPDFCPYIYSDGVDIFLEFTTMVMRFPLCDGGLAKALKHVPNVARQPGYLSGGSNVIPINNKPHTPKPKFTISRRTLADREAKARNERLSPDAKNFVRNLVRKMG
jgi:hypothetical protein